MQETARRARLGARAAAACAGSLSERIVGAAAGTCAREPCGGRLGAPPPLGLVEMSAARAPAPSPGSWEALKTGRPEGPWEACAQAGAGRRQSWPVGGGSCPMGAAEGPPAFRRGFPWRTRLQGVAGQEPRPLPSSQEQENVLQRVLQLPAVSGACECLQKTYSSTKEAHPLVASVCSAYEKGVQGAGSLAAWGMEPVVRRLSTQFTAANDLACRGLDHLEEKIPALQYPPEKIASELKDSISTRLRSARNSISVPIASTSDKVLGAALASAELAWGVARDTAEYAASTRAGRLASCGADLALGGVEKAVEFLLPPAKGDSGHQLAQKSPKAKPGLVSRAGSLASTLSQRTLQTTARVLKQGHALAMWIPGVAPLSSLAQWGASAAMQVVQRRRESEVPAPWLHSLAASALQKDHGGHTDSEGEATEEESESESELEEDKLSEVAAGPGPRGLLGSVAHTLQRALRGTISLVTWAPAAVLGTAGRVLHLAPARAVAATPKGRAMSLSDALKGVTDNVVDTVVHYVPLPRLSLMEPESEFRDIENLPREPERRGSGARSASPEPLPRRLSQPRGSLRARSLGLEDRGDAPRPGLPAAPREKPKRRVSDSFFRPSVMEPILGCAQYSQLRKKS
ncbi:Perilipin-1 [Galemys pyrenaicus]|uniref:Perilipin-1 n=1 Tax=Galemys pyrenaicus TaxID=202257 RepID=A0A8J6A6G6_GALPY|nr:Perilipin-1 [Galemys pyrenaicus]